jgi:uncharacterized RDD family membrane protein YckC
MNDNKGFADQLNIETPEQVELRFSIAGIGSRFLALFTDTAIQSVVLFLTFFLFAVVFASAKRQTLNGALSDNAAKWFVAAVVFFFFLLYWGYFSLFEAFWNGQTPGKRLLKIRVIKDSGRQITLFEALARNLLRVIDMLPPNFYLVGVISMLCNKEQKRLGDFVAGTIVVHERSEEQPLMGHNSRTFTAPLYPHAVEAAVAVDGSWLPADAVARLDAGDLHVIDTFFGRALDLDMEKREEMAGKIAARMSGKMGIALPEGTSAERGLETIAFAMRSQGRR